MQQISDYELELMKIIWANGGTALYAEIFKSLEEKGTPWTKNTIITLTSRLIEGMNTMLLFHQKNISQHRQCSLLTKSMRVT